MATLPMPIFGQPPIGNGTGLMGAISPTSQGTTATGGKGTPSIGFPSPLGGAANDQVAQNNHFVPPGLGGAIGMSGGAPTPPSTLPVSGAQPFVPRAAYGAGAPNNPLPMINPSGQFQAPGLGLDHPAQHSLDVQNKDLYGHGYGQLLTQFLQSIGGNNNSYMDAFKKSMAPVNAENLATIDTSLGNAGIGADSSTSAITKADYQANVSAQEGLQSQQLLQHSQDNFQSLLQHLLQGANKQNTEQASGGFMGFLNSALPTMEKLAPLLLGA